MAIKVQDADVQAKLEGASKETCNTLSMIRPDYMLSQTAGVNYLSASARFPKV